MFTPRSATTASSTAAGSGTTSTPASATSSAGTRPSVQYRNGQRLPLDGLTARLSVNPRARRLSIRIDARAGEAVLIAPSERKLADVVAFARTKSGWMRERLAARVEGAPLEPGAEVS